MLEVYDLNYSRESLGERLSGYVRRMNDDTEDFQGSCNFSATLFQGEWILDVRNQHGIGLSPFIRIELDAWLEEARST